MPTGLETRHETPHVVTFEADDGVVLAGSHWPGDPGSPTMILLHGGGQTRHSWKRAGDLLSGQGYSTLTMDLRGHGDSSWSAEGNYAILDFADDVRCIVRQLAQPVVLVGASLGGLSSLLASTEIDPDVLAGLVLVDVVPQIEPAGQRRIQAFMQSTVDGFDSLDEAAEVIARYLTHRTPRAVSDGLRRNLRQGEDGRWRWHWDPTFITNADVEPGLERDRLEHAARALQAPSLLIRGLLSDVVSDEGVAALRALCPAMEYVELDAVAHTAAGDDNDAFVDTLVSFVDRRIHPATASVGGPDL